MENPSISIGAPELKTFAISGGITDIILLNCDSKGAKSVFNSKTATLNNDVITLRHLLFFYRSLLV